MFTVLLTAEDTNLPKAAHILETAYNEWCMNDKDSAQQVVSVAVTHHRWTHPSGGGGMHYLVMTVCYKLKQTRKA